MSAGQRPERKDYGCAHCLDSSGGACVGCRMAFYRDDREWLAEQNAKLLLALRAQEKAEDHKMNCSECGETPEKDWACCSLCSPLFGKAIDLRRHAIATAKGGRT